MLPVYSLANNPVGDVVIVKVIVNRTARDEDFSVDINNVQKKLTSLGYTVHGSFLKTDPAAALVKLDECKLIA